MIRTVEAVIDEQGNVRLLEPVHLPAARRALVMIFEEHPVAGVPESALLSETALADDWIGRKRTKHGHTFSGCGSPGPLSFF